MTPKTTIRAAALFLFSWPVIYIAGASAAELTLSDPVEESAAAELLPASCSAPAADARLFPLSAPLILNGRYLGDISVTVTIAGRGAVDVVRLAELLAPVMGPDEAAKLASLAQIQDTASLTEFCSGPLRVAFQMSLVEVHASLSATSMASRQISFSRRPMPNPESYTAPNGFAAGLGAVVTQRYLVDRDPNEVQDGVLASFEGYANFGGFDGASLFYSFDVDEDEEHKFRRNEIQVVKDFYNSAIRLGVGEVDPTLTSFQAAPPILGFSLTREYRAIQPFQNILSTGRGGLVLDRDSSVDVYVNGVLTETLELQAGQFELSDFPTATGTNDVELVVRDQQGRVETTNFSFFSRNELLGEGLLDFSLAGGVTRKATDQGYDYGDKPMLTGYLDYGLTSWLTVGTNFQVLEERAQAGLIATIGGSLGSLSLEAVASRIEDELNPLLADNSGTAVGLTYRHNFDIKSVIFNVDAAVENRSEFFTGLTTGIPRNNKTIARTVVRMQLPNRLNISLSGNFTEPYEGRPETTRYGLNIGRSFGRFNFSVSASQIEEEGLDSEFNAVASLTIRIGQRGSVRSRYSSDNFARSLEFVRNGRQQINDVRGRLSFSESQSRQNVVGNLGYRHNRFESNVEYNRSKQLDRDPFGQQPEQSIVNWRLGSFLGYADKTFAIGRPSPQGFIITRAHRSLRESDISLTRGGGLIEARTGLLGPALVPVQRAYFPQKQNINVEPLPVGYDLGTGEIDVLPGFGSGYTVMIGSDASRTLMGRLNDADGEPVALIVGDLLPENGDPELQRQFFTNSRGRFVAERVAAGTYRVMVDGVQSAVFVVDAETQGVVDVGEIVLP